MIPSRIRRRREELYENGHVKKETNRKNQVDTPSVEVRTTTIP